MRKSAETEREVARAREARNRAIDHNRLPTEPVAIEHEDCCALNARGTGRKQSETKPMCAEREPKEEATVDNGNSTHRTHERQTRSKRSQRMREKRERRLPGEGRCEYIVMVSGETRQSGQTKGPSEYGAEYERWAKNIKEWQVKPKGGAINHSACVGYEKAKENQYESEPIKRTTVPTSPTRQTRPPRNQYTQTILAKRHAVDKTNAPITCGDRQGGNRDTKGM